MRNNLSQIWEYLRKGNKKYYTKLGFFALGDAYLISGQNSAYEDCIVLVEHRERHQYNHWGFLIKKSEISFPATIFTNGDDNYGKLNRKALSLKLRNFIHH